MGEIPFQRGSFLDSPLGLSERNAHSIYAVRVFAAEILRYAAPRCHPTASGIEFLRNVD